MPYAMYKSCLIMQARQIILYIQLHIIIIKDNVNLRRIGWWHCEKDEKLKQRINYAYFVTSYACHRRNLNYIAVHYCTSREFSAESFSCFSEQRWKKWKRHIIMPNRLLLIYFFRKNIGRIHITIPIVHPVKIESYLDYSITTVSKIVD